MAVVRGAMSPRSSDERREKRKKFILLFISYFTTWFNLQFFLATRSWPDTPVDRRILGALISALLFASVMSWFTVYYSPKLEAKSRKKCLEIRQRLQRKISMGEKPSRWDKLLEKLWCSGVTQDNN
jgi:hypothetical protein